jgi:hypothetical protein
VARSRPPAVNLTAKGAKATRQAALDAAYRDFISEALPDITNRYH